MLLSNVLELQKALEELKNKEMPFSVGYQLYKLNDEANKATSFYEASVNQLIQEYGDRDEEGNLVPMEEGNGIKLKPECIEEVNQKLVDLLNTDLPMPSIKLELLENIELPFETINILANLIEE